MARYLYGLFLLLFLFSCSDEKQQELQRKEEIKNEKIFSEISSHWHFNADPVNGPSQDLLASWPVWRDMLREMSQKPQSSIGSFQKKSEILSAKAKQLASTLPGKYDLPEVKSRISVLTSQVNALNLHLHLKEIPSKKVNELVDEINLSLTSLQQQFGEIERKKQIPMEQGESDFIRMLDTTRAVPTNGVFPGNNQKPTPPPGHGAGLQQVKRVIPSAAMRRQKLSNN